MRRLVISDADHGRIRSKLAAFRDMASSVADTSAAIPSHLREKNREIASDTQALIDLFDSAEIV